MISNIFKRVLPVAVVLTALAASAAPRTITINEDRSQQFMTSKVYKLKHVKAHNIAPFIEGAMKRMDGQSAIQSLDYQKGSEQMLMVSTSKLMIPYVDQMISMLDYPSAQVDATGNHIEGTGISRWVYCPEFRSGDDMNTALKEVFTGGYGSGSAFYDNASNMFLFKSSKSEGDAYMKFLKELDRPIPQVEMELKVYLISDSNFRELGIDYVSWKNGPGAQLFNAEWLFSDSSMQDIGTEMFGTIFPDYAQYLSNFGLGTSGGYLIAPSFDATFIRILAQKGKAWSATAGTLMLSNDPAAAAESYDEASYRFKFTPEYMSLIKDDNQGTTVDAFDGAEYSFFFSTPIICFGDDATVGAKTLMGTWNLSVSTPVESSNTGVISSDVNNFSSALTLEVGVEKLVGVFDKEVKVKAYSGIPFLGEIPVLKYIFGSESLVNSKAKVFVTMTARPVITENVPAPKAGEMINTAKSEL